MIDTIKFFIPISNYHDLIYLRTSFTQFKKEDLSNGKIQFEFYTQNVELGSFSRSIAIRMCDNPQGFFLEYSLPKYAKGNNVEMIYAHSVYYLVEELFIELNKKIKYKFPHFSKWEIYKLDICYNWYLENELQAKNCMSFIQRIDYPRKQKYVYDTSVMYKGVSYTIKFYLKGAEFYKHDFKALENNRAIEIYEHAKKILRFEVSLKRQQVKDLFGYNKVCIFHIINDDLILEFLKYYLEDKVFKYINKKSSTDFEVEKILFSNFSMRKATMLYMFYKNYYFDTSIRQKIINGGLSRKTIWTYKTDLKKVGIGFDFSDDNINESVLDQLVIPSKNSKFDLNISC